ncbi:TRAP transporter large permease [Futiania mangrovi]|uniref:TRAP transporter large permease protein n=1 Tax=Futiania mangrovi TaxID=2959716 RepID=A0A9J6PFP4_9PROT|nr:TRAP transporter large permease [Futiania mangrovii]MCP1335439.1 TRAP transporter large permease [Futiania mangrovii]
MDPVTLGFIGVGLLVALIVIGVPVAFAAAVIGIGGLWYMRGIDTAIGLSGIVPHATSTSYELSVLPLFIAIGFLALHAGITRGAFQAARLWLGRAPGGLATATIFASAGFSAVSGASTATAAVFTRLAVPEMEQRGYDRALAAGVVAVGGTLAALIPPSAILVIYGILVEESIGRLLLAGIIPGIISMAIYMVVITIVVKRNPSLAPSLEPVRMIEKLKSLTQVWGILAVVGVILGGVYFGWMTPTESAAVGTAIILSIAATRGMRLVDLKAGLLETVKTTAMIFMVIWGVLVFVRFLAFTGMPAMVTDAVLELDVAPWVILMGVILLYLVMGMVLDGLGMLILTLPVIYPAIIALGYDPIWFGVLVVKMIEIGLITPPVGLNCYVVHGVRPDIPLEQVFRGVAPFLVGEVVIVAILVLFPEVVLFLPDTMMN